MARLREFKFHSIFIKTFVGLIIISLVPTFIAIGIIYKQSIDTVQEQILKTNSHALEKTINVVDLILQQVADIIPQVSNDYNVVQSVINPDYDDISRNSRTIKTLQNVAVNNDFIHSIYVYSAFEDIVISSGGGVYRGEQFNDKIWIDFYKTFTLGTEEMATREIFDIRGNDFNVITIIRNIPYRSWSKIGALVININQDEIFKLITGIDLQNQGTYIVIDKFGDIILHEDRTLLGTNISKTQYNGLYLEGNKGAYINHTSEAALLVSFTSSEYNSWKYIYTIPFEEVQDSYKNISILIILTAIAYSLIGLILAYYLSRYLYNPVKKLIADLVNVSYDEKETNDVQIKNEYDLIEHAYKHSIQRTETLKNKVDNFRPVMLEQLFIRLLTGQMDSLSEVEESLHALNASFSTTDYIVLCIQIDGFTDYINSFDQSQRNLDKLKIMQIIENNLRQLGLCISIDFSRSIIVTVVDLPNGLLINEGYLRIENLAEDLKLQIKKELPFSVTIGIGRIYNSIMDVVLSYSDACNALEYKMHQGRDKIFSIRAIDNKAEELYYHSDKEKQLINNLIVGDEEEVVFLIEEIFQNIAENRNLSHRYVIQVFSRILNAVIEAVIDQELSIKELIGNDRNLYEELENKETINDVEAWFKEVCLQFMAGIEISQLGRGGRNIDRIRDYIDQHLSEDVSLDDVAAYVNLSPAYVSKIFKDSLQKNFVDYVNSSRVEKAMRLLEETRLTTKAIGIKVGFNSVQSFFRTFKKYSGITPGQYRDIHMARTIEP